MKVFVFFYACYLLTFIKGQNRPSLQIIPNHGIHKVFIDKGFILRCEIVGLGPQVVDVNLKWFDPQGREITDVLGLEKNLYVVTEPHRPAKKLNFKALKPEHEGTYVCEGVVEGNLVALNSTIVVLKAVTFDHAPSPQMVKLHSTALIECRVSGEPSPTISWSHKGVQLINNFRYSQDERGLYISNVTKHDEGAYSCQAEDAESGLFIARTIEVIVQVPPKIDAMFRVFEGIQGQDFTLPCRATGDPSPKFEFFKDGQNDPIYSTKRKQYDPDGGELTFRPLHGEDAGTYTCKAFNNVGEDSGDIKLNVVVPPSIYSLYNQTGMENDSAELVCLSYGDPTPQMSFARAGAESDFRIGENEDGRILVRNPENGKLVLKILRLIPEDMANYTCKSTNKGGSDRRNGTITVQFVPRFTKENVKSVYIWPGKTRNITCHTMSEPLPSFEWIKFHSIPFAIRNNETYRIHIMGKNSNLQVTVREQDQNWIYGNYTCRASNQLGRSELLIDLIKAYLPGPPKKVEAAAITSDYVILHVTPPENDGGLEVLGYKIEYEANQPVHYTNEILIERLRPSTTFAFRVRAMTEVGFGEPYTILVKTDDVTTPRKLTITSSKFSQLPNRYTITWAKPVTGGMPIKEYEFKFRRGAVDDELFHPTEEWKTRRRNDDDTMPMTSYTLESLRSGSHYQIEVRARNDLGYSEPNERFVFFTLDVFDADSEPLSDSAPSSTLPTVRLICLSLLFSSVAANSIHLVST